MALSAIIAPGLVMSLVQYNRNYLAQIHADLPLNGGASVVVSWGTYASGGELVIGGVPYDVRHPLTFDGRAFHAVSPWLPLDAERHSLVFFRPACAVSLADAVPELVEAEHLTSEEGAVDEPAIFCDYDMPPHMLAAALCEHRAAPLPISLF